MGALEWITRNCTHTLSLDEARCLEVLCTIAAPYNLPLIGQGWSDWTTDLIEDEGHAVEFGGRMVCVRLEALPLSTYDSNALTRLVLAAHERAVRVEISAEMVLAFQEEFFHPPMARELFEYPQACLRIQLDARVHGAESFYERHPNIEEATIAWRGARIV